MATSPAEQPGSRAQALRAARKQWAEFIAWAQLHPSPRWIFRGHAQYWPLLPSIGRLRGYKPETETLMFDEFRRTAHAFLDRETLANPWDALAIAQHYGLPTRLLDWTNNPLVAAFFASVHSPRNRRDGEVIAVLASDVGFYRPDDPSGLGPFEISEAKFVRPSSLASRITAQRGLFSIHPTPAAPWRLRNKTRRFTIPAMMKTEFQKYLFSIGVDAALLMADLDGLSRTLRWRFENGVLSE